MGLILGTQLLAANVTQPYPDHGLKRTPIKVALLSLPPRTQSLLEFFFTNAGRGSFMACTEEQAETAIFDLDTPASRDHWLVFNARTGCPGIALAVKPQEVPGALWVQKPVTPAALLAAAASLRAAASAPPPERVMPVPATLTPDPAAAAVAASLAPAIPAPIAPTADPAVVPIATEASPAPVAPSAMHAEAQPLPTGHPTPIVADAAVTAAPEARPATATPADELRAETLDVPAPAQLETAAVPVSKATATSPVPPSAETTAGGKTFWQRLFGTSGRKPASSTPAWAADEPMAPVAPPAKDGSTAATTVSATPESAPDSREQAEASSEIADQPKLMPAMETAEMFAPAPQASPPHQAAEIETPAATEPAARRVVDDAVAVVESESEVEAPASRPTDTNEADDSGTVTSGFPATEPAQPPADLTEARSGDDAVPNDRAADRLFGTRADVSAKELGESAALRFDPEKYLVGVLREAFMVATKWEVPTQFDCGAGFLVVDAERNELHSSLDDAELQALASTPLTKRSKVQTLSNLDYVRFKQALQDSGKARCTRLDDAIWCAALWGSAGRLPAGTNPSRTVFLRQWPNLTRITPVPQGPRLAALWALRGGTIVDSCKQFNLPQRHVIGFYNGVWALNLLTEDGSFARRTQRKGARNRGLLTRLLGWLRR